MTLLRPMLPIVACTLLAAQAARAQEGGPAWFGPQLGQARLQADYDVTAYFNEPVARQRTDMQMIQHDLRFSFPLRQSEQDEWTFRTSVKALDIDTDARLPRTWSRFPGELWDVRLGTTYRTRLDNGWIAGGSLTVGSPSDRPFASLHEMRVAGTGFVRIPHGETHAWLLFLNYANDREFLSGVPLPGVAYNYRPSDKLNIVAGVPMTMVRWEPLDRLSLEASYFIPRTVHAQVGYRLVEQLKLYAGFDWSDQRFFRHDRRDHDDRLFYYEKRVALGARWDITENVWLDLAGGWTFDRFWFEGEDYGDRGRRRLNLDDGPMLKLQLGLRM
jgi:hypothetical protein